jgi:hypothetical protein
MERFQGKIADVVRQSGDKQELLLYTNSQDFPGYACLVLSEAKFSSTQPLIFFSQPREGYYPCERVVLNEEIWRDIGKKMGFKFVIRKKKGV